MSCSLCNWVGKAVMGPLVSNKIISGNIRTSEKTCLIAILLSASKQKQITTLERSYFVPKEFSKPHQKTEIDIIKHCFHL